MIIYNGGTYDLLHLGHLHILGACRRLAGPDGQVVVALNTDAFVERYKGHPTVQPYEERAAILRALRCVDRVICNVGGEDSRPAIETVRPDVIVAGWDWYSPDDSRYCAQMGFTREWLAERRIALAYVPLLEGRSSTRLRSTAREMVA